MLFGVVRQIVFTLLALFVTISVHASAVVEEWIEPAIDVEFIDGSWKIIEADKLPSPPFIVQKQELSRVLINVRRVGLVWVNRTSVRLNEETLVLHCQNTNSARSSNYQNFGMRGDSEALNTTCIVEQD